jgi:hypothetical protein
LVYAKIPITLSQRENPKLTNAFSGTVNCC